MVSKNISKNIKYILIAIYILEFIYILFIPELIALYIFTNTVIQGFILIYLLKDNPKIILKRK